MTTAQILYGIRNDDLYHIDEVDSGLACQCDCPECHRPLVAKKGEVIAHHFAHDSEEAGCNPTPESLVHAYGKQQVAKLRRLILPGFTVRASAVRAAVHRARPHWRAHPCYEIEIESAEVEVEVGPAAFKVRPDVLLKTGLLRLAVEVFFRHRVPPEKIDVLRNGLMLSTVELDLSDLPVTASSQRINHAITENWRWKWLHNQHGAHLRARMESFLVRSTGIFFPRPVRDVPEIALRAIPTTQLAKANRLQGEAAALAAVLRVAGPREMFQQVRSLGKEMRIALHCYYLGIPPLRLPMHLMQTTEGSSALGVHPIQWQSGVFAKFCMGGDEFTAQTVEKWIRAAFQDKELDTPMSITQTANGFSPVTEALYHFLRNISAQGLLQEIKGPRPWMSRFAPARKTKMECREMLNSLPPASI